MKGEERRRRREVVVDVRGRKVRGGSRGEETETEDERCE
jgi:hypothetical protein